MLPSAVSLPSLHFALPAALIAAPLLAVWAWWLARTSRAYLPPPRQQAALATRLAVSIVLPLALAQPVIAWPASGKDVVFLIDRSASIGPTVSAEMERWLVEALAHRSPDDRVAFVTIGGTPSVEQPLEKQATLPRLPPQADDPNHTDLAAAIRTGLGLTVPEVSRRLVLLSDGQENLGSAQEAARLAAAAGVPIEVVPFGLQSEREISAVRLDTPPLLREGEHFNASLVVQSTVDTAANLLLVAGGRVVATEEVELKPGLNRFVLPVEPLERGTHVFYAEVEADEDTFPANNQAGAVSVVGGPPSILLVEGQEGDGAFLAEALRVAGLDVEVRRPATTAWDAASLRRFQAVVLVNVAAEAISTGQQRILGDFVRDFGGGLVVVGGDQAYGPGGYARTPLEEMLPVRMDLRGRTLSASVALVLAIDTSGSMGGGPEGGTKMDLAKEAALSAAELLGEYDRLGIVAFEDTSRWVLDLQPATDLEAVQQAIAAMQPGGGTDVYPALLDAYLALLRSDAKVKHVILLTDGQTPSKDWDFLTERYRAADITLSTIAIGSDADYQLLQRLAERGGGRFYEGNDPFDLPRLVVKETLQVQRAAVVEQDFKPIRVVSNPAIDGLDFQAAPPLRGYVATTPKPGSSVLLASSQLDPILTEWQYGLGRVLAWASDARNRWSARWLDGWPDFSRFWSQVVRRAARPPDDPNRSLHVRVEGRQGVIRLESRSDEHAYLNFLPSRATVVEPNGQSIEVRLPQTAPGLYEGTFPLQGNGAYLVQAVQEDRDGSAATQSGGVVVPYSQEYRSLGINYALLQDLARRTGGRVLDEPAAAFAPLSSAEAGRQPRPLWPWLATLAGILFVADVAIRRLRLEALLAGRHWRLREALPLVSTGRSEAASPPDRLRPSSLPSLVGSDAGAAPPASAAPSAQTPLASAHRLLAAKQRATRRPPPAVPS